MVKSAALQQLKRGIEIVGLIAAAALLALPSLSPAADAPKRYALECMTFTILTNEGQEAVVRPAFTMLKSAARVSR